MDIGARLRRTKLLWITSLLVIAGCSSPRYRAPVEDRGKATVPSTTPAPAAPAEVPRVDAKPAAPEAPAKPAFVTVKAGDTLIRIAAEAGQNWRDVARWNNITNPDLLEVGQALRVQPPDAGSAVVDAGPVAAKPIVSGRVESRPLDTRPLEPTKPADTKPADTKPSEAKPVDVKPLETSVPDRAGDVKPSAAKPADAKPNSPPAAAASPPLEGTSNGVVIGDDVMPWIWPASGSIGATFDGPRQKGVTILGKAGDPVVAAGDGRVIYAGSSLRGYGNIVIIKHNNTYITAYAHNRTLLVKEEQAVRRGQRIAEMGSTDAERVQLHFELRKNGVAVDPMKHLPAR
jgi:lipoprotein NlpD